MVRKDAKKALDKIFKGKNYEIEEDAIELVNWDSALSKKNIIFLKAGSKGDIDPLEQRGCTNRKFSVCVPAGHS